MASTASASTAPALEIAGVGRRFGALAALEAVSITVPQGERRAILGANGAGKTTLFNVITGDLAASAGRIYLDGRDITRLAPHRRTRLGLRRTYQTTLLFGGLDVQDNLLLAVRGVQPGRFSLRRPGKSDYRQARDLAGQVGITNLLTRKVHDLAHGEQRQLEVGMALVGTPRVILLDEPAAGLGPNERETLGTLLRGLERDLTIMLIEHDMDLALQTADTVTVMHQGQVIIEGTPAVIQASQLVHDIYMGRASEPLSTPSDAG